VSDKNPLFSVTITTYNHGKYIKSTIESVLKQTIQDFEIIVIDDGSPDDTRERVLNIKDKRVKYFRQNPSGLPAYSRNRAIERSRGRYIALLDGDDLWSYDKLENAYETFSKNPHIDILCHDIEVTGKGNRFIKRSRLGPYPKDMYSKMLWDGNCLGISMAVLKREVFFEQNLWFDEDKALFTVEDYDFWLRLAESGKFNFHYLPKVLAEHVVSEESAILSNIEKHTQNAISLFNKNIERHNYNIDHGRNSIIRKRRASMIGNAALSHNYNREYSKSLRMCIKAIKEYPFAKKYYAGLILSLFRIRLGRI